MQTPRWVYIVYWNSLRWYVYTIMWRTADSTNSNFAFLVMPLGNCDIFLRVISWLSIASLISCSTLFLVRVCSVYHDSKKARILFCLIWLIKGIGSLVLPFSFAAAPLGPSGPCALSSVTELAFIPILVIDVFDTVVFVAISYRAINFYTMRTHWQRFKAFFTGTEASPVYKALLRTGQLYFVYVHTIPLAYYIGRSNFSI